MPSIAYSNIQSRFFGKVQAYDFLDLSEVQIHDFLNSWLHSEVAKPYIRKLFATVSLDDEVEELSYTMAYQIDEASDTEFVIEVLAVGLIVEWLNPKINSITNIAQMFGSSDEKWFSQSSHLAQITALRDSAIKEQRNMVSDRGYIWNSYLGGTT